MSKSSLNKIHVIILAAGYATRLYPLTLTRPKHLLPVAGKPILEHILENFIAHDQIERIHIIVNNKFHSHFENWFRKYSVSNNKNLFNFINDGSVSETDKLGAIGDLNLALSKENIDSDVLVIAGDNLLSHSLEEFIKFSRSKKTPVLGVYDVKTINQAKKFGVVSTDNEGVITSFKEKPEQPDCTMIGIALYFYPKNTLPLIKRYLSEGNNPDQPGRLVEWLYSKLPFCTWKVPGIWFDIGSKDTLAEANRVFGKNKKNRTCKTKSKKIAKPA